MDPFAVLGVAPGAPPEEVAARYRTLAKRWHPDRARGADAERRMALINAAYDQLRGVGAPAGAGASPGAAAAGPPAPHPAPRPAGWWLGEATRRELGPELLAALGTRERVDLVAPCSTWAGSAVLAVTDRRLLWLHDDAVTGRVRSLRWVDLEGADVKLGWPRRARSTLRVRRRGGKRLAFGELTITAAESAAGLIAARTRN